LNVGGDFLNDCVVLSILQELSSVIRTFFFFSPAILRRPRLIPSLCVLSFVSLTRNMSSDVAVVRSRSDVFHNSSFAETLAFPLLWLYVFFSCPLFVSSYPLYSHSESAFLLVGQE